MTDFPSIWFLSLCQRRVRDVPWCCISLELQMKTVRGSFQTKEYVDGWIYLNMRRRRRRTCKLFFYLPFELAEERDRHETWILLIIWCLGVIWLIECLSPAASAFSERYLGLPKPDPRAYSVRFELLRFKFRVYGRGAGPLGKTFVLLFVCFYNPDFFLLRLWTFFPPNSDFQIFFSQWR